MRNGRLAIHSHAAAVALVFAAMAWAVQPVPASAQSCTADLLGLMSCHVGLGPDGTTPALFYLPTDQMLRVLERACCAYARMDIAECLSSHSDPVVARNGRWLRRYLRVQRRDPDAAVRLWRRTVHPVDAR